MDPAMSIAAIPFAPDSRRRSLSTDFVDNPVDNPRGYARRYSALSPQFRGCQMFRRSRALA